MKTKEEKVSIFNTIRFEKVEIKNPQFYFTFDGMWGVAEYNCLTSRIEKIEVIDAESEEWITLNIGRGAYDEMNKFIEQYFKLINHSYKESEK